MSRTPPSALVEGSLKIKLSTYSNRFDIGETYFYHYSSHSIRFVCDVKSICTIFGVGATFSFDRLTYFVRMLVNHGMHCDFDMIYNSSYIFCFELFIFFLKKIFKIAKSQHSMKDHSINCFIAVCHLNCVV